MNKAQPIVAVGALGGTIAMTPSEPGKPVAPGLSAEQLIEAVPELREIAEVRAESIRNLPSPSIMVEHVRAALDFARASVDAGAAGVILTHGTDTLEETAYLLDLVWDREEPLVVTGAMRSPTQPGADGAANLLASVVTACSADARGLGVVTVLDGTVHLARLVTKSDSTAVSTFQSLGWGPVGRVEEGELRLMMRPARMFDPLPVPAAGPIRIPIVESPFADDGEWVSAIASMAPRALVIDGSGAGHVSEEARNAIVRLREDGMIVVVATRTGSGTTLERTYGYPGSEVDLLEQGVLMAGYLSARKARLLVHVLLEAGYEPDAIRDELTRRGR